MDFKRLSSILVIFAALCCTAPHASAQGGFEGPTPCARASRLESNIPCEFGDRPAESVTITTEFTLTTQFDGLTVQTRQCQANALISYLQKNTLASVDVEIENLTCGASNGKVVLSVFTVDESRERTSQEFTEEWSREDDELVTLSAEYPIGENVELSRVRIKRVSCTCAEVPQADAEHQTLPE